MEKDDEVKGGGNSYDFDERIYDCRTSRFLSRDPKWTKFPELSPYTYAANSPIKYVDANGEGVVPKIEELYDASLNPKNNPHDAGATSYDGKAQLIWNEQTQQYDYKYNVTTKYTSLFLDEKFNTWNQGFFTEVKAHERKHQEQIFKGLTASITYVHNGVTYTGRIDEVATALRKAGVNIFAENNKIATDLQQLATNNLNRMYPSNAGPTGTAETEAIQAGLIAGKKENPFADGYYSIGKKVIFSEAEYNAVQANKYAEKYNSIMNKYKVQIEGDIKSYFGIDGKLQLIQKKMENVK